MNHNNLLALTAIESLGALIATVVRQKNLLPIWLTSAEATNPSDFTQLMAMGYGFWALAWAVPNYLLISTTDRKLKRRFAQLSAVVYVSWWLLFTESLTSGMWKNWILLAYIPVRSAEAIGNLYFGFLEKDRNPSKET
jgi:hypothetical protein